LLAGSRRNVPKGAPLTNDAQADAPSVVGTTSVIDLPTPSPSTSADEACKALNSRIESLHASLPSRSALIVFTGHGSPLRMVELQAKYRRFEEALRRVKREGKGVEALAEGESWKDEEEAELQAEVARAREGMAFFCVKS
jgi:RNA exonuclease 1